MSIQHTSRVIYGYAFSADKRSLIPDDILDDWCWTVDGWADDSPFILGINCLSTELMIPLKPAIITHIENTELQKVFKELPEEAKVGVKDIPQYWLVHEVS